MVNKTCLGCGKVFSVNKYRENTARFCSKQCHNYAGSAVMDCVICGKTYRRPKSHMNFETKTCSLKCRAVAKKNETANPPSDRGLRSWFSRRGLVIECEICKYNTHPEILQVHHKDSNRDNNNLDNLVIVCPNCHCVIHYARGKNDAIETREVGQDSIN